MDSVRVISSPLGPITLAAEGDAVTGLWFEGQRFFASTLTKPSGSGPLPVLDEAERWLSWYFAGKDPGPLPKLAPRGTPFQKAVWDILLTIPRGQTASYGQIAGRLAEGSGGLPADAPAAPGERYLAARAVGGAVGHNPISILIPCHRVLRKDGGLGGYAGGTERKTALLKLEGVPLPEPSETF